MKNFKVLLLLVCCSFFPVLALAQPKVTSERVAVSIETSIPKQVEAGKESRTPVEQKMSSQFLELRAQHKLNGGTLQKKNGVTPQSVGQNSQAQVDLNDRVHIYLRIKKDQFVSDLVKDLQSNGIIIAAWNKDFPLIEVWATVPEIDGLAAKPAVIGVDLVLPPVHNTGAVNTEGDARMHSDVARSVMGASGSGIKVGVMSDDCGSSEGLLATRTGNGELGAGTTVIDDSKVGGRTHEGLAMMEIVQDIVPSSTIYFATASTGEVQFANNIHALANNGCKVITDDVIYFDEPVFEDGGVAQAVNSVATVNGVVYTSAAANQAQNSYFGIYNNIANQPVGSSGNFNVHNFGAGTYGMGLLIGANSTATVTLHWDDQYGASGNDYDLYLVNQANNLTLASSTAVQNGAGTPWEILSYTNPGGVTIQTYLIAVRKAVSVGDPNATARIKFTVYGFTAINTFGSAVSSTFGHSAAVNCLSAGAIDQSINNYNTIENFSNQGPVYMVDFTVGGGAAGSRPLLSTRLKPDVASIDGVSTSVTPKFAPFYGTSAATPHVAGVAAQLMGLYPSITPAAAQTAIRNGCVDYGAPGPDNVFGYGRTDAFRTIALYRQSISPGTYTANFSTPNTAIPDNIPTGITSTLTLSPTVSSVHPTSIYVSTTVDGHNQIGDLIYTLKSPDNTTITLMNRPVSGAGNATGKNPNIIFGDAASTAVQTANPAGLEELGFYIPANAISTAGGFGSHALGGTWTLTASDNAAGNTGTLKDWGIYAVESASASKVYIRSNIGEPWGVANNTNDMNGVFGAGNWTLYNYETVNTATMLAGATFIFMEGSDQSAQAMVNWLAANSAALQTWVSNGGRLFMNSAPNNLGAGSYNLGFGGVTLTYPNFSANATAAVPTHPIFNGPFTPVGTSWTGNSFAHAKLTGGGTTTLINGSNGAGIDCASLCYGSGAVIFGTMTTTNWQGPSPQADNLRKNILSFVNSGSFANATVSLSPSVITISNQSMQTITATVTITCATSPSFQLLSVTSSDADAGTFPGDQPGDVVAATGTAATTFQVRAETIPNGNGRVYTATYRAFDGATIIGDFPAKVVVLQNGGFVTDNSAGTCGLQLASSIPDFTAATLTIPYNLTSPGTATLSVYSLNGKELARPINNVSLGAGAGSVTWNGKNDYGFNPGTNIPNGTYVLLFKGCGGSDSRAFTINH